MRWIHKAILTIAIPLLVLVQLMLMPIAPVMEVVEWVRDNKRAAILIPMAVAVLTLAGCTYISVRVHHDISVPVTVIDSPVSVSPEIGVKYDR